MLPSKGKHQNLTARANAQHPPTQAHPTHPLLNQGSSGHGHGGEPPRAPAAGSLVLLRVLPLVIIGRRVVVNSRAGCVRHVLWAVARPTLGRLGRVRHGRRRRSGSFHGFEQLDGLQHRIHRIYSHRILVIHRGLHLGHGVGCLGPDAHLVTNILHREVVVPRRAVGGERVHGPVAGLEPAQGVVHRHGVEQQQRRFAVVGELGMKALTASSVGQNAVTPPPTADWKEESASGDLVTREANALHPPLDISAVTLGGAGAGAGAFAFAAVVEVGGDLPPEAAAAAAASGRRTSRKNAAAAAARGKRRRIVG
nr:unnamed protein product [Digitaria exilis]